MTHPSFNSPAVAPSPIPGAEIRADALAEYRQAWREHALASQIPQLASCSGKLDEAVGIFGREELMRVLPSATMRPLLAAAVIIELTEAIQTANGGPPQIPSSSPILQILALPYHPLVADGIVDRLRGLRDMDESLRGDALRSVMLEGPARDGINSSLRNLLLAERLNKTVLRGSQVTALVAEAQYSWKELNANTSRIPLPDLEFQAADQLCIKLAGVLAIGGVTFEFFDYGQAEGLEHQGRFGSGEGIDHLPTRAPPGRPVSPTDFRGVESQFRHVAGTHARPGQVTAIRRLGVHGQMLKFLHESPAVGTIPSVIAGVPDLTPSEMQSLFRFASFIDRAIGDAWRSPSRDQVSAPNGTIFSPFAGLSGRVETTMPSTRSVSAATDALRLLGMTSSSFSGHTSRDKGETIRSEGVTFGAHGVQIVLRRDPKFEDDAREAMRHGSPWPARVSLGGGEHHPTQTLGEVKLLMETLGCTSYSLEELRERSAPLKPVFTVLSKTDQKRADKAIIRFILEHLPEWRVRVIVPLEKDIPQILVPGGARYECMVGTELRNPDALLDQLSGSTFLYTSNAEATTKIGEKGTGDGKLESPFLLTKAVLDRIGCWLLHPLPASDEMHIDAFDYSKSLLVGQMRNKVSIIASITAHLMAQRGFLKI